MKKGCKISIIIVILLLIQGYFYYTFPRKISLSYNGIKYKVGDSGEQKQIKIAADGYYYNKLFTKDSFEGSISIDNKIYPGLKLSVDKQLQMIYYRNFQKGGSLQTYGEIFVGEKLKNLTICIQDAQNGWNSKNGLMISAPAKNREEALEISNKLMNNYLKKKLY